MTVELSDGWLARQMESVSNEIASWPQWMQEQVRQYQEPKP